MKAFEQGELDVAEEQFEAVLERAPSDANAAFDLGLVAEKRGDLEKAEARYQAALSAAPAHLPSLQNLARLYRTAGKPERAVALYEKALKQPGQDRNAALLVQLAHALRSAKQYERAEAAAKKALTRKKDDAAAYQVLSVIYFDQGNDKLAEYVAGLARKLDDKDPGVHNTLGLIALKRDNKVAALASFQRAVAIDPGYVPAQMNVGAIALSVRDYANAEKAFAKVLEVEPSNDEARLRLAYALDGQKGRDPKKGLAAGEQFEKLVAARPDEAEADLRRRLGLRRREERLGQGGLVPRAVQVALGLDRRGAGPDRREAEVDRRDARGRGEEGRGPGAGEGRGGEGGRREGRGPGPRERGQRPRGQRRAGPGRGRARGGERGGAGRRAGEPGRRGEEGRARLRCSGGGRGRGEGACGRGPGDGRRGGAGDGSGGTGSGHRGKHSGK